MGQCDKSLRLLVVDPDERFRAELGALSEVGIEVAFVDPSALLNFVMRATNRDVVVFCVETPALLANVCERANAPPGIAIAAAGVEGKSLEKILVLAEVRGAAASLPKPVEGREIVLAATHVLLRAPRGEQQTAGGAISVEKRNNCRA
jgi:DNA-binding response OmpR family regulator